MVRSPCVWARLFTRRACTANPAAHADDLEPAVGHRPSPSSPSSGAELEAAHLPPVHTFASRSWARRPTLIDRHLRAGRVALLEQAAQPGGLQRMLIALHSLHLAVIMHRHATAADVTTLHVRPAAAATAASQTLSAGSLRFGARGDGRGTPSRVGGYW